MIEIDFLIIGAGIIGLTVAHELSERFPDAVITIIEKEKNAASHSSGRNSGVLHAGFYYHADSLKARLTLEGNRLLTEYCLEHGLSINQCGKVVVAKNEEELSTLLELKRRGDANKVLLHVVDRKELEELEPNARIFEKALYSPTTSTIDPEEVCLHIAKQLEGKVRIIYGESLRDVSGDTVALKKDKISFRHLINCSGLYADKVAHKFGAGRKYAILPFKGIYVGYDDEHLLGMHVYPVPDLKYPFLGIHFTKTVNGKVKVGPTAVPAFWRENYKGFENFKLDEFLSISFRESKLFLTNSCNFRELAIREMKKYFKKNIVEEAGRLVKRVDAGLFGKYIVLGIRAQLFDSERSELVNDFVIEKGERSTHILNAVSPAFTCSFVFAKHVVDLIEEGVN